MASDPSQLTIEFQPERRVDVIDVNQRIEQEANGLLQRHSKALYCSYHTTGGYLEETICNRLDRCQDQVHEFLAPFRELFPFGADYRHDQLHLRKELSPEQRRTEPRNADSHLTFIGSGLENCVTYPSNPSRPVFFIDLDGINKDNQDRRERRTTVIGYDDERLVHETELEVPVSDHPIDSVSLRVTEAFGGRPENAAIVSDTVVTESLLEDGVPGDGAPAPSETPSPAPERPPEG